MSNPYGEYNVPRGTFSNARAISGAPPQPQVSYGAPQPQVSYGAPQPQVSYGAPQPQPQPPVLYGVPRPVVMNVAQPEMPLETYRDHIDKNPDLQHFLDKFIEKLAFRILRYINKYYMQKIYKGTLISTDDISNIKKFIIYLWIILSFYSAYQTTIQKNDPNAYIDHFNTNFDVWFRRNIFAEWPHDVKSEALLKNLDINIIPTPFFFKGDLPEDKYNKLITSIELKKLINIIYNIILQLRTADYKLLSLMFADKYNIYPFIFHIPVCVKHNNYLINYIILNNDHYDNVASIERLYLKENGVIINLNDYTEIIDNFYYNNNNYNNIKNIKNIKVIDFIPVYVDDDKNVKILYTNTVVLDYTNNKKISNFTDNNINKYFLGMIVNNDNSEYLHNFNTNTAPNLDPTLDLKFKLYLINDKYELINHQFLFTK
jgi:hypothetical protein